MYGSKKISVNFEYTVNNYGETGNYSFVCDNVEMSVCKVIFNRVIVPGWESPVVKMVVDKSKINNLIISQL